jgi:hypothetical protein
MIVCKQCRKVHNSKTIVEATIDGQRWLCTNPNCRTWNGPTTDYPYDVMPVKKDDEANGGSTPSQYELPPKATELQDLIEYREMNFSIGNIFKACYRMGECSHSDEMRDLNKIIWFAKRELALKKGGL